MLGVGTGHLPDPPPPDPTPPDPPPPTTGLYFDRVSKIFPDGTEALLDVTCGVRPGEIVSLVGPTGCGKSTLLRIAAGLATPTSGSVTVGGGGLGFVFQDPTLLPWRTVLGNVQLLLELRGVPRDERAERALAAIRAVGLEGFEQHHPKALSGGMRMRASLARWLTLQPSVFLFDEPFAAVDEITRERLNTQLLRLFLDQGFAGLFVTHSIFEAVYLSSRVLVMSARPGRIAAEVTVALPYPRAPELRFDPALTTIAGQVSAALRDDP